MKQIIICLAAAGLAACQLTVPGAPAPTAGATPPIGPECTGPGPGNFNGARLTQDVIAQIPRQFANDRTALAAVLAGRGTPEQIAFARKCHGLTI